MAHAASKPALTLDDFDRRPVWSFRLLRLAAAGVAIFAAWKIHWRQFLLDFFTGPGRISRILMVVFALLNVKNLPFVWTYRLWHGIAYHLFIRKAPRLGPRSLFRPMISESHAPLLEIDYNIHKSNSTYFSDLDVARTHMACHLLRPGFRKLTHNKSTALILDDKTGRPRGGHFGIMLGGVHCSFRREITAYAPYEMWTRVLAWDRKWLYMVTHFVPRGVARPTEYLDTTFGTLRTRSKSKGDAAKADGHDDKAWEKKIHATAVSKYVFKLGRLTVHPAVVLDASELLPARPGGLEAWQGGSAGVGDEAEDLGELPDDGSWDWKMVEKRRRDGMKYAQQFANLDELESWFDGGDGGDGSALGRFGLSAASW